MISSIRISSFLTWWFRLSLVLIWICWGFDSIAQHSVWKKEISIPGGQVCHDLMRSVNGGYTLVGLSTQQKYMKYPKPLAIQVNGDGDLINWREYSQSLFREFTKIFSSENGDFAVIAKGYGWFSLCELNDNLEITGKTDYKRESAQVTFLAVHAYEGSGYIFLSHVDHDESSDEMWMIWANSEGKILFDHSISIPESKPYEGIIFESNQEYLEVIVSIHDREIDSNRLLRFSAAPKGIEKLEEIRTYDYTVIPKFFIPVSQTSSLFLFQSEFLGGNPHNHQTRMSHMTLEGDILFIKPLSEIICSSRTHKNWEHQIFKAEKLANGDYFVLFSGCSHVGIQNIGMALIDYEGNLLFKNYFEEARTDDILVSLIENNDSLLVVHSQKSFSNIVLSKLCMEEKLRPVYSPPKSPPQLFIDKTSVSYNDQDGNFRLSGGEKANLHFSILNNGDGKAQGLRIKTKFDTDVPISIRSKPFKTSLNAGEATDIELELIGAENLSEGTVSLEINVSENFGFDAPSLSLEIATSAYQPPRAVIADYEFISPFTGVMNKGVTISLEALIQNLGTTTLKNLTVKFIPPDNVISASDNEHSLASLASGESKAISYSFFANRRFSNDAIPIYISLKADDGSLVGDTTLSVALESDLKGAAELSIPPSPSVSVVLDKLDRKSNLITEIPSSKTSRPNGIAVVIGNKEYEYAKNVDFATTDSKIIKKYLIEVLGFEDGNILYFENASLSDFRMLFGTESNHRGKLFNFVKAEESEVFIYYSGHGASGLADKQAYFVPVDCDPNYVESSGFPLGQFYTNVGKLPAKEIFVITDACFSGADLFENISPVSVRVNPQAEMLLKGVVINSSQGTQVSTWHTEERHGLFTWSFLDALRDNETTDANADRKITVDEVFQRISDWNSGVPYWARRLHGITQTPVLKGENAGQVLFEY